MDSIATNIHINATLAANATETTRHVIQARNVVVLFTSGTAIIAACVVFVYGMAIVFDRYCFCCPGLTPEELEERRGVNTLLLRRAKLATISRQERQEILHYFFQKVKFQYTPSGSQPSGKDDPTNISKPKVFASSNNNNNNNDDDDCLNNTGEDTERGIEMSKLPPATKSNNNDQKDQLQDFEKNTLCFSKDLEGEQAESVDEKSSTNSQEFLDDSKNKNCNNDENTETEMEPDLEVGVNQTDNSEEQNNSMTSEGGGETEQNEEDEVENDEVLDQELQEAYMMEHVEGTCAICLSEYSQGEDVITGTSCSHLFHYNCAIEWLDKGKDHCPYCRKTMLTPQEMRNAAIEVLGEARVQELTEINAHIHPIRRRQEQQETPVSPTNNNDNSNENEQQDNIPEEQQDVETPVVAIQTGSGSCTQDNDIEAQQQENDNVNKECSPASHATEIGSDEVFEKNEHDDKSSSSFHLAVKDGEEIDNAAEANKDQTIIKDDLGNSNSLGENENENIRVDKEPECSKVDDQNLDDPPPAATDEDSVVDTEQENYVMALDEADKEECEDDTVKEEEEDGKGDEDGNDKK